MLILGVTSVWQCFRYVENRWFVLSVVLNKRYFWSLILEFAGPTCQSLYRLLTWNFNSILTFVGWCLSRFGKCASTVVFAWENIFVSSASYMMMMWVAFLPIPILHNISSIPRYFSYEWDKYFLSIPIKR